MKQLTIAFAALLVQGAIAAPLPPVDPDASPDEDFENRCSQPGVFLCDGFDDPDEFFRDWHVRFACQSGADSYVRNNQGLQPYPNNRDPVGNRRHPAPDPTMVASGSHSLRLTTATNGCSDQSGEAIRGTEAVNAAYGDFPRLPREVSLGETMHAQFRMRFDRAFAEMPWDTLKSSGSPGSPKLFALYGDSSCGQIETTLTYDKRGFLHGYTNCGGGPNGGFKYDPGDYSPQPNSNFLYSHSPNGTPDGYYCLYNQYQDGNCPIFEGYDDQWWTVYLEVTIGPRFSGGQVCESYMRAWVSRGDGEPMKQYWDYGPFCWGWNQVRSYDNVIFWLYQTSQNINKPTETNVWYDELILSTQPLPVPARLDIAGGSGNSTDNVAPAPPTQLRVE